VKAPALDILARDCAAVAVLAVISAVLGVATNHLRGTPLPLSYQTPQQRLAAELGELIRAPAFELSNFATVPLDEFEAAVRDHRAVILDARAKTFYDAGHVPGALNLSRADFARDYVRLRPQLDRAKDAPIIVYCSGGECQDSRMVASALLSLGFSQVRIFTGGWPAWTAAGQPVAH